MKHDVIIIGAGPVGLLLGGLLGVRGLNVLILEKRSSLPEQSQAIGITPPSLEIMQTLGLAESMVQSGTRIRECQVHGLSGRLGRVSFDEIGGAFPFILSLPQRETMRLLEEHVGSIANVSLRRGVEVVKISSGTEDVIVHAHQNAFSAAFVVACDGWRSPIREMLGIRTQRQHYGCKFVMGDFIDRTAMGDVAHVFFTPAGAVESFPLPAGRRRWIVQTDDAADLIPQVRQRTGIVLAHADQLNESAFAPWRLDCAQVQQDRVLLCGDAAHVMSPIGGQGMNTGFADAEFVAEMLLAILRHGENANAWMARYARERGIAASTASRRAALGMGLGVWRGVPRSLLRDGLFRLLLNGPLSSHVAAWFAMRSLPHNRLRS